MLRLRLKLSVLSFSFLWAHDHVNMLVLNLTKKTQVATAKPLHYKCSVLIQSVLGSNQLSSSSYHLQSTLRITCLEGNVQSWAKQWFKQGLLPSSTKWPWAWGVVNPILWESRKSSRKSSFGEKPERGEIFQQVEMGVWIWNVHLNVSNIHTFKFSTEMCWA